MLGLRFEPNSDFKAETCALSVLADCFPLCISQVMSSWWKSEGWGKAWMREIKNLEKVGRIDKSNFWVKKDCNDQNNRKERKYMKTIDRGCMDEAKKRKKERKTSDYLGDKNIKVRKKELCRE